MIIDLASIGRNPRRIELTFGPDDVELDAGTRLASNVSIAADISRESIRTKLSGRIEAELETDCFRCLEPVSKRIGIDFEDVFVAASEESEESAEEETELGESELDESLVVGGEIDIAEVVREQLILTSNERVLCTEDCKGLCPKCGGNRNLIDCKCEENEIDPRWAALKNLN